MYSVLAGVTECNIVYNLYYLFNTPVQYSSTNSYDPNSNIVLFQLKINALTNFIFAQSFMYTQ